MNMPLQSYTDQMGRTVRFPSPPHRIISLVPSQTELLGDLGLDREVVGVTKFCIHPVGWRNHKPWIGGTKNVKLDKIAELQPDLIIGNKEENDKMQIEALAETYPVWMSDVHDLPDALDMIRQVGRLTDTFPYADQVATAVQEQFEHLDEAINGAPLSRVAYFIWREPYLVVGNDTFINAMIRRAGFENVFGDLPRYPQINLEDLAALQPDRIFLSSEPFPFREKHLEPFRQACPRAKIQFVQGDLFSWYGSRLLLSARYFLEVRNEA